MTSFLAPDLKIGVTLASFHSAGISPVEIVRLTRYVIGLAITGAACFKSLAEIPCSGPEALVTLPVRQLLLKLINNSSSDKPIACPHLGHMDAP